MLRKKIKIKHIITLILFAWIIFDLYAGNYIYTSIRPEEYFGNNLQYHHRQLVNDSFRFVAKIKRTYYGASYLYVRENIFGFRQFMELSTSWDDPLTVYHAVKIGETVFGDCLYCTGQLSDDGRECMKIYLENVNKDKVEPLESEKFLYSE